MTEEYKYYYKRLTKLTKTSDSMIIFPIVNSTLCFSTSVILIEWLFASW